jgi:predicted signal transduction protein with EAL and GGDEF domain
LRLFFVDTITVDTSTTTIVEMLVALARDFHMTVVAEGVETEEQVRALISLRCPARLTRIWTGRRYASSEHVPVRTTSHEPPSAMRAP